MKIHHTKKAKYTKMKEEQGVTRDELLPVLLAEEIPEEAAQEFLDELYGSPGPAIVGGNEAPEVVPPRQPAKKSAIKFDYENLTGDEYQRYLEHFNGLDLFQEQDFLQFKVEPVMTEKYPGLPGTPINMTGIQITNSKPLNRTRISPKVAAELNAQVRNSKRYYLLAQ